MKNKKAISALIETVLLILVVIAAAGIVFYAVIPMISGPVEKARVCQDLIEITSVTPNDITIMQTKEANIDNITINAFDASGKVGTKSANKPVGVGSAATTTLPTITGGGQPIKVSVVAIANVTGKKIVCSPIEAPIS
ncbi:MAG: hypothetical protein QW041_03200 [Candidatus Pacearchaeota archaeon]